MSTVIWFTGLSGSGKSTIAAALKVELERNEQTVEILDGDAVRLKLHKHLGFSREDVRENNRLIAELTKKSSADVVLVPIISPYRADRAMARSLVSKKFVEVFVDTPLDECIKRDVKGLYKKAERGMITDMIGVHTPYEKPEKADVVITSIPLSAAVRKIMEAL